MSADIRAMTDAIAYRGPDEDGQWLDGAVGLGLGHRRLSIVDLTATGAQPMTSRDGRIVVVYNGELYNTAEMRAELGVPLRGTSDTEVLVEAIARFGIDGALQRANGLFAFAAFDRSTRILHLARDRLGIKPLYWTHSADAAAFASELKALRALPQLDFELDPNALAAFLRHGNVPAPLSIFRNVHKLRPGHRLEVTSAGTLDVAYWDLTAIAITGQMAQERRSEAEVADALNDLLKDAVKRQMISDVPLGAFLSGGIDSSTVVALMCTTASGPVRTFSIGFRESAFNEADDARRVAEHLGTDHTELTVDAAEARTIIPQLPDIYDEPFADSSQIPTYLVSRLARRDVTVALSGDGGDENFGGYVRYQGVSRLWNLLQRTPRPARRFASHAINSLSVDFWNVVTQPIPTKFKPSHFGDKIVKGSKLLLADGPYDMYQRLISQWPDPAQVLASGRASALHLEPLSQLDTTANLRLFDMQGYLPDDILTKVDRASMAVSLEVRVPLLDHRVVEFAWRLPSDMLIRDGLGKRPLRAVLDRYVPRHMVDRPKTGFGVPIGKWIAGPLREWTEDLLSAEELSKDGLFNAGFVRKCLDEHLTGRRNWQYALWTLLQFQAWKKSAQSVRQRPATNPTAALGI